MPPTFNQSWDKIDAAVRVKLAKEWGCEPDAIPPSSPEGVASALGEPGMADARENYRTAFAAMYDLVEVSNPYERPDLFPLDDDPPGAGWQYLGRGFGLRVNGLPMHDWILTPDGEIDKRLSAGISLLHLNLLADGGGRPLPTNEVLEHYHPDPSHPQKGNVHFVVSHDKQDAVRAWMAFLTTMIDGFEAAHALWDVCPRGKRSGLKHPLAALIEGWLRRPELIQPDVDKQGRPRKDWIIPEGLFSGHPQTVFAQLRSEADQLPTLGKMPELESVEQLTILADIPSEDDLPITPLILADAAGFRGLKPGRGARLDKRLLIFSLLAMPLDQRRPGGRYEWRPPLRELRDLLWPARTDGLSSYRPVKHGPGLMNALDAVSIAKVELASGGYWRPLHVWKNPDLGDLDGETIIEISLPEGSDHGPLIDKSALVNAGTISDPAFDIQLGLAYLWDEAKARTGGNNRIYATRPEVLRNEQGHIVDAAGKVIIERGHPSTRWNHPRAIRTGHQERHPQADRVRVLDREERRRMAYGQRKQGQAPANYTRDCNTTDGLLASLEAADQIVIERNATNPRTGKQGWRILEAWPGE